MNNANYLRYALFSVVLLGITKQPLLGAMQHHLKRNDTRKTPRNRKKATEKDKIKQFYRRKTHEIKKQYAAKKKIVEQFYFQGPSGLKRCKRKERALKKFRAKKKKQLEELRTTEKKKREQLDKAETIKKLYKAETTKKLLGLKWLQERHKRL